ncbi:hypothetical protein GCM10027057_17630 [Marisediminicola antarctica]|uniref:Uncharacterized protein n=1 Tax=Marisediminicola antarctica TaxID=674079 RepID=A0A7L5ANU4_9MICO|nr:hypothetical protein BHD05_15125 [Marisediminicola antarctica]
MTGDWFGDLKNEQDAQQRVLDAEVNLIKSEGTPPDFRYKCTHRDSGSCVLAEVYVLGDSHVAYLRRYTLPKSVNESRSSASGRSANTEDGQNHWRARVVDLDSLAGPRDQLSELTPGLGAVRLTVQCRHVSADLDPGAMILDAVGPEDHRRVGAGPVASCQYLREG